MTTSEPSRDIARAHFFAQFHETFGACDRPERLYLLAQITGHPVDSTREWTEAQFRWTAKRLRPLKECPDSVEDLKREAYAATAPEIDTGTITDAMRQELTPAETVDEALALCSRISDVGAELLWSIGDAANILISAAPGARKRDILAEHLRTNERLKPLLSSAAPSSDELDPSALNRWLFYARVAGRVPVELRESYAELPYTYFAVSATALMTKGGLRVPVDLAELERRLSACADNEHVFRKPADLRRWLAEGSRTTADGSPEQTNHEAAFREYCSFLKLDPGSVDAILGAYSVRKRGKR